LSKEGQRLKRVTVEAAKEVTQGTRNHCVAFIEETKKTEMKEVKKKKPSEGNRSW